MKRDVLPDLLSAWSVRLDEVVESVHDDSVVTVRTATAELLVLKDHGSATPARQRRFAFDTSVVRHLDAAGVPVAAPRRTADGRDGLLRDGHLYTLSPCLRRGDVAGGPAGRAEWLHNCGRAIAGMHAALATYDLTGTEDATWKENIPEEVVAWVGNIRQHVTGETRRRFESGTAAVLNDLRQALRDLPSQLIHRDCHTGNVLFAGTEVTGFVDCDHFCVGPRLFDLAEFAVHLFKWDVRTPGAPEKWLTDLAPILDGYEEVGGLTAAERVAFPYMMLAVHLVFASYLAAGGRSEAVLVELDAFAWLCDNLSAARQATGGRTGSAERAG